MGKQYKLASQINIEVFGGNTLGKLDSMTPKQLKEAGITLDKDGKVVSIPAKWQSNRKNRFHIKKGENVVPAWVLEAPMVKHCLANSKMTKGDLVGAKPKPNAKKAKVKKTEADVQAEQVAKEKAAEPVEQGLPEVE